MMKRRGGRRGLLTAALLCAVIAAVCVFSVLAFAATHTCVPGEKTVEDVVAPTCMTEGSYNEVERCVICNEILTSKAVSLKKSTVHTWGVGFETKAVTRTEPGEMTYYCIVDGCPASKTEEIPVTPFRLGDVDNDGHVTAGDARLVLRYSVGLGETDKVIVSDPEDLSFKAADFDGNGTIDAGDARLVLRQSVGLAD